MTRSHAKAAMGCDALKWYVDIDDLVIGLGGGGSVRVGAQQASGGPKTTSL